MAERRTDRERGRHRETGRQTDRQSDRQTVRQTGARRQAGRQAGRQTQERQARLVVKVCVPVRLFSYAFDQTPTSWIPNGGYNGTGTYTGQAYQALLLLELELEVATYPLPDAEVIANNGYACRPGVRVTVSVPPFDVLVPEVVTGLPDPVTSGCVTNYGQKMLPLACKS